MRSCPFAARRRGGPAAVAAALITATAIGLTACGGVSSGSGQPAVSGKVGDTLTVAWSVAPQTLDPAKAVQNDAYFDELAYEPLIVRRSNGKLAPGLAQSWEYTGAGNTTFVLHLRPGVKFADGGDLTAQGVADDLRYVVASSGQMAPLLSGDTFTATDPSTVTITGAKPNPDLPIILTQDYVVGGIISPAGLHATDELGTRTFGAGPYMLDPAHTVDGDHYTYVPNPNYYDKASVHWHKVVIRVITDAQSVLNALKTGQADAAGGDPATVSAATQAGLTVTGSPLLWSGVVLADRDGALAKPLADVRVRQALNYATDRAGIAKALFGGIGQPTDQLTVPGGYGFDAALNGTYPYDVAKARKLLTAAGYSGGFSLRIVTPEVQQLNLLAQALAQQWKQVGVDLRITDYANDNQYVSDAFGAKFPAFMTAFGQLPLWMEGPSLYLPAASFNPFHTTDPALQALFDREARSSGAQQASLDQQIEGYLVHQAWFVPVVTTNLAFYARKTVTGTATSAKAPLMELYEIQQAA